MRKLPIILGSGSKARKELMKKVSDNFIVKVSDVDETIPKNIVAHQIPLYLSDLKAASLKKAYPDYTVIGADTLAYINDIPLGKPKNKEQARDFLQRMSGTKQKVITGVSIYYDNSSFSFSETSYIHFININKDIIERYINTEIPYDKAGGIAVEQKGEFSFVKEVAGSFSNVMGLPVTSLRNALIRLFLL